MTDLRWTQLVHPLWQKLKEEGKFQPMNTDGDSKGARESWQLNYPCETLNPQHPQSSLEFTNPDQDISPLTTHNTFQNFCYEYIILSPLRWIIVTKKRFVLYRNSSKFSMRCCCWVHKNHSRKTTKCNVERESAAHFDSYYVNQKDQIILNK